MAHNNINNTNFINSLISKRFLKFLVVGAVGTAIDFVLFYFLFFSIGFSLVVSNLLSYGTGLTSSFFWNKYWTFADRPLSSNKKLILSLLYGYLGLFINTAIVWLLGHVIHVMLAKAVAVIVVVIYNYFTNKIWVFNNK